MTAGEARASQWWLEGLGVSRVQAEVTRGEGVTVCLLDSGVDAGHPSLQGTHFGPGVGVGPGMPVDGMADTALDNHGTSMALLLAGSGDAQGEGVLGVAPEVTVISVAHDIGGGGEDAVISRAVGDGIKECVDRGASVISMSFVAANDPASIAYAQARDVVLVAGTGNGASLRGVGTPANRFGVLAVGGADASLAVDPNGNRAGRVPLSLTGDPDQARDSGGVSVLGPYSTTAGEPGSCGVGYAMAERLWPYDRRCGGTSGATAIVAGVAALVRAAHPELNAANVINRIISTATIPTGESAPEVLPSGAFGFGVVDAYAAVTAQVPVVEANPLGSMYAGGEGVWLPGSGPSLPEPQVGQVPGPAPWQDQAVGAMVYEPQAPPGEDAVEGSAGAGSSVIMLALGGGAVAILLVIGLAVVLIRRTRNTAA